MSTSTSYVGGQVDLILFWPELILLTIRGPIAGSVPGTLQRRARSARSALAGHFIVPREPTAAEHAPESELGDLTQEWPKRRETGADDTDAGFDVGPDHSVADYPGDVDGVFHFGDGADADNCGYADAAGTVVLESC